MFVVMQHFIRTPFAKRALPCRLAHRKLLVFDDVLKTVTMQVSDLLFRMMTSSEFTYSIHFLDTVLLHLLSRVSGETLAVKSLLLFHG